MKQMINMIRKLELMMGNGKKIPQTSEKNNIKNLRRSIVAKKDITKGKIIRWRDLNWIRLYGGIAPGNEKKIINKKSLRIIKMGELIKLSQIE